MHRYIKVVLFSLICLVGAFFVSTIDVYAQAQTIPAPTMIEPDESVISGKVKPLIKGLIVDGTLARVYIDGVYNGKTEILAHDSGTANFAYKPFLNLAVGEHTAWAIAEDETGQKSCPSNMLKFRIEQPMPAPTIFSPVASAKTAHNRPFIVGLAKNNSLIKVFIGHKLNGQFQITNHESGTANFAYQPFQGLTKGRHLAYITATDNRGKESCWSNIVYFTVKQSAIDQITAGETIEIVAEIKEIESDEEESAVVFSKDADIDEDQTVEIIDNEIQQIIEDGIEEEEASVGLINEDKEKQGKLNTNLIVFIVFLFGIIAWIFWVNRELIKERRSQAKKAQDEIEDKIDKIKPLTTQDIEKSDKGDSPSPPQEQPPLI